MLKEEIEKRCINIEKEEKLSSFFTHLLLRKDCLHSIQVPYDSLSVLPLGVHCRGPFLGPSGVSNRGPKCLEILMFVCNQVAKSREI